MINKEYGSDFHLCLEEQFLQFDKENIFSDDNRFSLFFSGRSAIYSLLKFGISDLGWRKVYFPGYYCHEVVRFIKKLPIEVIYYPFNPFLDNDDKEITVEDRGENVVINVSFFGVMQLNLSKYKNIAVIDDLTHNITAFKHSTANYCFGSLRKQLPLPCGGFCYSPGNRKLPVAQQNVRSEELAFQKTTAMFLKREYLEGRFDQKEVFRDLFSKAEKKFEEEFTESGMPGTVQQLLTQLNIECILEAKKNNAALIFSLLKKNEKVVFNLFTLDANALGLLLMLTSFSEREKLKTYLIFNNIYPAVLWPGQIGDRDIHTEKRVLFIHIDYRYDAEDIKYIAHTLNRYFDNE